MAATSLRWRLGDWHRSPRQVEIHPAELVDVGYKRLSDGDMAWVPDVLRQGFSTWQRHDNAVGEALSPIGATRSALDLLHDGHEVDEASYGVHVLLGPAAIDAPSLKLNQAMCLADTARSSFGLA